MVDIVLKLTKPEVTVSTTPSNISNAILFRIYTPASGSDSIVTIKDSAGNIIGSMTHPAGFVEIMEKRATDTVEASTPIKCTPVAYK